jgi:hypothetical protein
VLEARGRGRRGSSRAQPGAPQPRNGAGSAPRSLRGRGLGAKTFALIEAGAEVLAAIQPTSVRAVCYKLFTQGLIPDMSKLSTNRVSRALVQLQPRPVRSFQTCAG